MGVGPGEYGVRPDHSTFQIIRNFATMMRRAVVSTPPRQECEAGCWLPAKRYGFETCALNPELTSAAAGTQPAACASARLMPAASRTA